MRSVARRVPRSGLSLPLVTLLAAMLISGCAPAQTGVSVGDAAPDFNLPSVSGGDVSLADYEGQPVLLFFHMAVG